MKTNKTQLNKSVHEKETFKISFPLVVRLILITSVIVIISIVTVTSFSSYSFIDDSRARAEENNLTLTELVSQQIDSEIEALNTGAVSLFDTLRVSGGNRALQQLSVTNYFDRNARTAYIAVPGEQEVFSPKFFLANELESSVISHFLKQNQTYMDRARAGETLLINASPVLGVPTAALMQPYRDLGTKNVMIIIFSTETIQSLVQTESVYSTRILSFDGSIIAHSDFDIVKNAVNFNSDSIVNQMMNSTLDNKQLQYRDEEGTKFIGAFRKVSQGQFAVVTTVPFNVVNKAALNIARQALYIAGVVLLFSILSVWFFSRRVSRPVYALVDASHRISSGEFELDIKATSKDELGLLTESFVQMGHGLAERERVKKTFGKFVNPQIAEMALKGDLQLGGIRRNVTIFFSDIRAFTAISEAMAPEAVVEFLNDYMTLMVDCIEKTGGVVDKFIGDAIMAVWGAPFSAGSEKKDALQAVKSMLLMRDALFEFNKDRGRVDKPVIRIGCGVNTGPCLAGQIGSHQRMEYTVIGDAVNLASRIEALNKPFATDILISEYTYELIREEVQVELMSPVKVKGKTDPLQIYAVLGMKDQPAVLSLDVLRNKLGITLPADNITPEQEEEKYEILEK